MAIPHHLQQNKTKATPPPQFAEIANLLHPSREQHIAGARGKHDCQNCQPAVQITDCVFDHEGSAATSSFANWRGPPLARSGPLVTTPTPADTKAIPSHRIRLIRSCRANRAMRARSTYPRELAGSTYVRSAQESAIM